MAGIFLEWDRQILENQENVGYSGRVSLDARVAKLSRRTALRWQRPHGRAGASPVPRTMMLVKIKVAKSPIEGLGVFAAQFIPKGTKTWEFTPGFDREFSSDHVKKFPIHIQEFLNTYAYISPKTGKYILPADDERFTNHSANPNTTSVAVPNAEDYDIASHDIQRGEEITTDYNLSAGKINFEVR